MKMMHGAFFLPCSNRSRTREAPTPTNISTKSEPLIEKKGTFASPATARASRVLPVPGEPINSTPFGMWPPSFWKRWGSFRNSMISWSSSLASSTPATSLKVTFFCVPEESFALLLPNDSALLPPLCIWRMKKIQNPIIRSAGAQEYRIDAHGLTVASLAWMTTLRSISLFARPSNWFGAYVRNVSFAFVVPVTSFPAIVTSATWPESTHDMNSLKLTARSRGANAVWKFQTTTATMARTSQNNRLLRVEFTPRLPLPRYE